MKQKKGKTRTHKKSSKNAFFAFYTETCVKIKTTPENDTVKKT